MRMVPFGVTVGRNVRRTPYSRHCIVMALAPVAEGCTTGNGNSPPARKLACSPLRVNRFGSASISRRFWVCRAWISATRLMSGRRKSRLTELGTGTWPVVSGNRAGAVPRGLLVERRVEDVQAELHRFAAVHVGKPDLQQDLRLHGRNFDLQQVDGFTQGGSDRHRAVRRSYILYLAPQKGSVIFKGQADVVVGKIAGNLLAGGFELACALPDGQVVDETRVVGLPNDQRGFAGSGSVDQHFFWIHGNRFGESAIGDMHAPDVDGAVNDQTLAHSHQEFAWRAGCVRLRLIWRWIRSRCGDVRDRVRWLCLSHLGLGLL